LVKHFSIINLNNVVIPHPIERDAKIIENAYFLSDFGSSKAFTIRNPSNFIKRRIILEVLKIFLL